MNTRFSHIQWTGFQGAGHSHAAGFWRICVQSLEFAHDIGMDNSDILCILMPERAKQVALAWSILRDAGQADDAYQDMLAKVFENESIFEGPNHLRDWSWKVLRNRCFELIRQQQYRPVLLDEAVLDLVDSELESRSVDDFDMRANALHACLDNLTQNAREIIRLRFFEGLRATQVAEKLGRKPDAVYKALQRSYAALAECIRQKLVQTEPGDAPS